MRYSPALAALAVAFGAMAASPLAPDTPLITDGKVVVDAADFEGNMLRIPENRRAEVRMSYDRVVTIVDNIYIDRALAQRARDAGMDRDPAVQRRLQQVQDGVLAGLYRVEQEKAVVTGNLEPRARELYKADQARYRTQEMVHINHILVNLNGRTREAAMERARKVYQDAKGGEDFLSLAAKYSDDNDRRRHGGDLGLNAPTAFSEPVRNAIAKMKDGEISEPVESEAGFHIVKLIERKKSEQIPFEAVRDRIIAAEKERLQKQKTDSLVQAVRSSATVTTYRENIEKLVVPVDPEMLKRAMEGAQLTPAK